MSHHFQGIAHRSSISQHSRSISQYLSSEVDDLTDEELIKKVNDLKRTIKILTLENEILEKTILRLEPALMHGVQQALEYAFKIQSSSSMNLGSFVKSASRFVMDSSLTSPSRLLPISSPSRVSTRRVDSTGRISGTVIIGSGPKINVLERSELVGSEVEILIRTLEKGKEKAARQHALLKAQIEEVGVRVSDVEKATELFNQEVVTEGWDKIAQRIPAEIWIRFMTEWVKVCDSKIGKLRLRTSTLNTQFLKLKGQIKVKAELSESLRPVDFEKLKIENDVCLEVIDQKLHQLAELKKMTGDANLTLTVHKKALMEQDNYLSKCVRSIKSKEKQTVELDKETEVITNQSDNLAVKLEEIKNVRLAYEVPDILDYVKVKSDLADLKHSVKLMENRAHVQQIALKSLNKKLNSMFFY